MILSDGETVRAEDLPASVTRGAGATGDDTVQFGSQEKTLREMEMEMIHHVLDKHQGDKPKTAKELGIALKTLYNKLNQYQTRAAG